MTTNYIGKPESRVDGRLKVMGGANYAADFDVPNVARGYVVSSRITKGKITEIDTTEAEAVDGVLKVLTHENRPATAWRDANYKDDIAPGGSPFRPLNDGDIVYNGQPVALVVAEDFETARYAATLVKVKYEIEPHETDLDANREKARKPKKGAAGYNPPPDERGDAEKAWDDANFKIEADYSTPIEHHNPMEIHASTVVYEDDGKLTIYDKTQGVLNSKKYVVNAFGLNEDDVRVMSPFMGGGFGSGLRPQYQLFLAVLAALDLKRSVKLMLTREQMFTFGHRPRCEQRVSLGAHDDGTLEALIHTALEETSQFEDFAETVVNWSGVLYNAMNAKFDYNVASLDFYTPLSMRAPGAVLGVYAIESAADEISDKLKIDPLEFRKKNYTYDDPNKNLPFSSKELMKCYEQGAEKFGWDKRIHEPRSMKDGNELIGYGMASGVWEAQQSPGSAKVVLNADGSVESSSATSDIGTGTYTAMTQITAEELGVPIENVTFKLGDSELSQAPIEGGSWTVSSIGPAIKAACEEIHKKLFEFAQKQDDAFAATEFEGVEFGDGKITLKNDANKSIAFTEILKKAGESSVEQESSVKPDKAKRGKYTINTHSACFVEVRVDEELKNIRVTRIVNAFAAGRIINPKTSRSQIIGGVVWGIGMALEEESVVDDKFGRFVNQNLAEYHLPVNADVPEIEVIFVEEHDEIVNPIGAKGLGEIGIVGVAAAIANAIYHATGKRVRDLPITLDKLL